MADAFTAVFLLALAASVATRVWLAGRQIRHVAAHADAVPPRFAARIGLEAHRKAAAYTIAKQKLALVDVALGALFVLALTVGGGLQALAALLQEWLGRGFAFQVAIVAAVVLLNALLDLPLSWYRQFRLEQRFGFNRMTPALFVADLLKSAMLAALFGLPLLAIVLWLMQQAGDAWWVYAWLVWIGFNALLLFLFPTVIAPLFNRFEPLRDETLAQRIQNLLARTGFASRGVFVMDGSRRSSHGNAYFTGFGRAKRIVFFDTLLDRLAPAEIEAVLAHELGHFKRRHIVQRLALSFLASLLGLALLGWLSAQPWFYTGLGVTPATDGRNDGLALVLFFLVLPVFTFFVAPLASLLSRRHEFEADAFAAREASATDLANALVKLYEDNASTLTPDPLYSLFYDSHPPASQRIERLLAAGA
ncbi:MAG: M48 family metallopeptidase [Burkholderiaceae bacterium]|nr:M48 family metallopeptidase [Burkholderiaceae bacterium]